jgi:high-affinity iron transporter
MMSMAIIVFREMLEISLILGVVLAATRGLEGRHRWMLVGIVAGIAGSCAVAFSAQAIADAVSGMGQELFNATVLLLAAALIGWTVVWMKRHSAILVRHLKAVGKDVLEGKRPLYVIAVVVALSVLRDGSEIVLLTYGVMLSGQSVPGMIVGAIGGVLAGVLTGIAIYHGLIKVAARHLFTVTGVILMFLAAAMVSQAVALLGAAGFIPVLNAPLWDTSRFLSERSMLGNVLHTLVGYSAQPSGIQFMSYLVTLGIISMLLKFYGSTAPARRRS